MTRTPPHEQAPTALPEEESLSRELPASTAIVVAAVVKHAFGMALGTVAALGLGSLTLLGTLRGDDDPVGRFVWLLPQFLPGVAPRGTGIAAALAWGFAVGYVVGWGTALTRNRLIKLHFWFLATRERLAASRDVLDELS